jgi:hypothetical protein
LSKQHSFEWTRKRRYAIIGIVAIIGISIAFYESQVNFAWKHSQVWNFDSYPVNTVPPSFAAFETDTTSGLWVIKADDSAPSPPNVLAKLPGKNDTTEYHLQIVPDSPYSSFEEVKVKFKIISGQNAQAAGLILRFVDNDHYFVLMADAQNNRFSLCKDEPGYLVCNYEHLASINIGQWHTMSATVSPEGIGGYLDNQLLIRANNEAYQTGQIGLWTKGDTEAYFDDLKLDYS